MLVISPVLLDVKELLVAAAACKEAAAAVAAAESAGATIGRTTLPPDFNPMPRLIALTLCF